ncbi:MAG: SPOR domain-containing protein [Flavobacteriales bacterium]|nr:SPOR domain-containing protein [Flavobacteriales bacterium]
MQNVKIDIYISDLLYSYDCVVIPDFGGFVANYASAKIQPIQHRITPPSKQISFNKNLKSNDGLLGNLIAEKKSLTYKEANELIKSFVNQSIVGLNKGDKIQIEKVGTLYLDPERNIQFVAEEQNDFLLDSFGLGPLRVQPIKREGAHERIEKKIEKVIPLFQEEKKKRRIYWPAAAILLVFFVSTLFLSQQFDWVNTKNVNYSSLGFGTDKASLYSEKDLNLSITVEEIEATNLNYENKIVPYLISNKEKTNLFVDNRKEETKLKVDNTDVAEENITMSLKFHVMGGCFSKISNAEGLVQKLITEGYDARLLGTYKKLHAVSFGSFARIEDAKALLESVKSSDNSAAWLLVKPF